jgi:hypothetical protein
MNRTAAGLIIFLVVLGLLGADITGLKTFLILSLILTAAVSWLFKQRPPIHVFKIILFIVFGPVLFIAVANLFIQTLSILDLTDAILLVLFVAGVFIFGSRLLK